MTSDAVMIALIKESMNAEAPPRRAAAGILLHALRASADPDELPRTINCAPVDEEMAVAQELQHLANKYGLTH